MCRDLATGLVLRDTLSGVRKCAHSAQRLNPGHKMRASFSSADKCLATHGSADVTKAYGRSEATAILDGSQWSPSRSGRSTPEEGCPVLIE